MALPTYFNMTQVFNTFILTNKIKKILNVKIKYYLVNNASIKKKKLQIFFYTNTNTPGNNWINSNAVINQMPVDDSEYSDDQVIHKTNTITTIIIYIILAVYDILMAILNYLLC